MGKGNYVGPVRDKNSTLFLLALGFLLIALIKFFAGGC